MLNCLPTRDKSFGFSIQEAIKTYNVIKSDIVLPACTEQLKNDVNGVALLLTSLKDGRGPTAQAAMRMSSFYKKVLGRCEHFLVTDAPGEDEDMPGAVASELTGRLAFDVHWKKLCEKPSENRSLEETEVFKRFAWMMSPEQSDEIERIINKGIRSYQESLAMDLSICDGPACADSGAKGGPCAAAASKQGGGSSSSSSSTMTLQKRLVAPVLASKAIDSGKKGESAADGMAAKKQKLLAMFKK
jgi:hypothetical protein